MELTMIEKQNYKCFYCRKDLVPQFPNQKNQLPNNPTKDHIVPKSEFKHKLKNKTEGLQSNTVICCYECNQKRRTMDFLTFYIEQNPEFFKENKNVNF